MGVKFLWRAGDVVLRVRDDFGQDHRGVLPLHFHQAPRRDLSETHASEDPSFIR